MDLAEGVVFSYVSLWTSWTKHENISRTVSNGPGFATFAIIAANLTPSANLEAQIAPTSGALSVFCLFLVL